MTDVSTDAPVTPVGSPGLPGPVVDPQELMRKWNPEVDKARRARYPFERDWYLNLAFIQGRQWINWNASYSPTHLGQLVERKPTDGRPRITVNRTRKLVLMQHSKIVKSQVRGYISPASPDDEDVAAARAGEKISSYLRELTKLDDRMNRCDWWTVGIGTSFVKTWYDPRVQLAGDSVEDPENPGEAIPSKVYGAPVVDNVNAFHLVFPDLDEPDLDNQEWICHITTKSAKEIKHRYGVTLDREENLAGTTVEAMLQSAQGFKANENKRGVEVKELWVKPCDDYPDGIVLTWTQDKVLDYLEIWPYSHGEYPFTRRYFVETGRVYGDSTVTDLRPLQMEYNRTRSQIIEDKDKMARPMMAYQQGSINPSAFKSRAGEMIPYKPGTPAPQPIPMQNLPGFVVDHLKHLQEEMNDLASQQALETGVPSGVTAATAIAYIQEFQDSILNDTLRDRESAYQRVTRQMLSLVSQYWDAQRQIKVVGQNQNYEAFLFKAGDLRGNTDWHVVTGSATPQSHAGKQALIMELLKMGAIPADRALQYLDMADTARLYEEMQVDVREAERQNLKMAKGIPAETADWQNLLVHISVHDNYRKREEFESLDDMTKQLFRHHVYMDMLMLAKLMGMELPPDFQQVSAQMTEMNPLFVHPIMEEELRSFVTQLSLDPTGGMSAPSNTAQPPPQGEPK